MKNLAVLTLLGIAQVGLAQMAIAQAWADGYAHIYQDRRSVVRCSGIPLSLDGDHTSTKLLGVCPRVRIAGEHNDVTVPVAPGGTIEITGEHNDVTWRQVGEGPPPRLLIRAPHNSFHPG